MNFPESVIEPLTAAPASASRRCEFGIVEALVLNGVWRWRCPPIDPAWSKATYTSQMDAYQGAAFAHYQA